MYICSVNIDEAIDIKKQKDMKSTTFTHRGSTINKLQFSEIEFYLEEKGINVNEAFAMMADENEFVYVSNGFLMGLKEETNNEGEWHHYFKKDGDSFEAGKLKFN